jgi:uncharacterized protein
MPEFPLLIKPASADCNLRCEYCFYLGHETFYPGKKHRMEADVLEAIVKSYLSTRQRQHIFIWQGGEPLLMGYNFFRRVVDLQILYGDPVGATISNGIQTNATLITDELSNLFKEYNFLIGVSLDGPEDVHDRYRMNSAQGGTHVEAMRGVKILKRHGVELNVLTLVSRMSAGRGAEIFNWLIENEFYYQQYIPCVEPEQFSITGEEWGDFMCAVFDEWRKCVPNLVSVRLFDSILSFLIRGERTLCHFGRICRQYFLVEHNGDVYPCDFYVDNNLKIGNILSDSWERMWNSQVFRTFGRMKSNWNAACEECRWLDLCAGDCPKHRSAGGGAFNAMSSLCCGWKQFFEHSMPYFIELSKTMSSSSNR